MNYIKNEDSNFECYIAHSINKIWSYADIKQWNYIPSSFNVVDKAIKSIDVAKLQSDHRWFVGADVLYNEGYTIDSESTKQESKTEKKKKFE